ncbi:alpha/beta-hydrolase [Aspergillus aurantiobrunneus]
MVSIRPKYQTATSDVEGYTRIKHVYIPTRDGIELCSNVPVICSMGPYGKDIRASTFGLPKTPIYTEMYKHIRPLGADAVFELCEPSIWCPDYGYALLRVDARGVGGSQGRLDPFGLERSEKIQADAEGQDLYNIVEWAAAQVWCTGNIAFSGISYFVMVGYWAAMQKPPHLACVMSYESACSMYQAARRGGIYSNKLPIPLLIRNRADYPKLLTATEYPTEGCWSVLERVRKLSDIEVPFYSAGNWTDPELHLPGNIRAYKGISSKYKWLEMYTGNHLGAFYEPDHVALQKKFLDYFLFDKTDNGKLDVPRLRLLQHGTETFYREDEISDAEEISFYLTPDKMLSREEPTDGKTPFTYQAPRDNLTFDLDAPFSESFELLDLDLFIYLRAIDEKGETVVLTGNHGEPMDSFARGYFRLSHRDEVVENFTKEKILCQPQLPPSEVTSTQVYSVLVNLILLIKTEVFLKLDIDIVCFMSVHLGAHVLPEFSSLWLEGSVFNGLLPEKCISEPNFTYLENLIMALIAKFVSHFHFTGANLAAADDLIVAFFRKSSPVPNLPRDKLCR